MPDKPTIPEVQWLIDYITDYVTELFNLNVQQRKILPDVISVDYIAFQDAYMKRYKHDDKVTHDTIRFLTEWIFQNIAVSSDPTSVITAIKFISPNLTGLDSRTMAAVAQSLILTGAGVQPTVPTPPELLPYEAGFDIDSNIVIGQLAWNQTDRIWYQRVGNAIVRLKDALDLQIEDITGLEQALSDLESSISLIFIEPLVNSGGEIRLAIDANKLEINEEGELTVKDGLGTYLSTAIPATFNETELTGTTLIIEHGLDTLNVKLTVWDTDGSEMKTLVPVVVDENTISVDFGSGFGGTRRYVIEFWKNQSVGIYPDPNYAPAIHSHNGVYAPAVHNHNSDYAALNHSHSQYALSSHSHTNYALSSHNHNTAYQAKGNYSQLLLAGSINGTTGAMTVISNPTGISYTCTKAATGKYNITIDPFIAANAKPFIEAHATLDNLRFVGPIVPITNGYQIQTRGDTGFADTNVIFKIELLP